MTLMNQPRPASTQAAAPAPPQDRETTRLLWTWVDLTRRAASAAAHRNTDEDPLRDLQLKVEEALTDRLPDSDALLGELWAWEAGLMHNGEVPEQDCLVCHLARLLPPEALALVPTVGGAS